MIFRQDVVYGTRLLRRSPVFALTAILSLTIGLAANAAIFSLADAVILRERPGIAEGSTLVDIGRTTDGDGFDNMSYPNFADLRSRATVFAGVAGYRMAAEPMGLGVADGAERVLGQPVTANYFAVLGVPMTLGRAFLDAEDRVGAPEQVTVISHHLWQTRFRGDPDILTRTIHLNGRPYAIVGVAAEGFTGNTFMESELWIPTAAYPSLAGRTGDLLTNRRAVWLMAVGRLKPGITLDQAHAEAATIARDLQRVYPQENQGRGYALVPSHRMPGQLRSFVTTFVALLFGLVGLVLAIACANVAGMQLARATARAREVALRIAVGAGRARIIRQLVTESLLLSAAGAAAGVLLAVWMIRLLRSLLPTLPVLLALDLRLDWRVMLFSVVLALVTGVAFGLVPALQAAGTDLTSVMKTGTAGGRHRLRLRQAFVVAQLAMSMLLVICGLLFARSLQHAAGIDPGFDHTDVEVANLDFRLAGYDGATGSVAQEQILARVEQIAGVRSAAFAAMVPLLGGGLGLGPLTLPGQTPDADRVRADWNVISPRYFETMKSALVGGRGFTRSDSATSPPVAVVNETFARRAWPNGDALGKTLDHHGTTKRTLTVVGIARDGKYRWLGEGPQAFIYVPLAQNYFAELALIVKTDGRRITADVRAAVRQVNPRLPIVHAATLEETTAVGLLPHRLAGGVAGAFGLLGLFLAAIGIYGITAHNVTQRTKEIGVRVALGAARPDVVRLVLGQAMRMSILGAAIGLLLAGGATQVLASLLFGVRPLDPVSFASGAAIFCALALTASWFPARRAASVNPVEALRTE
jgi:predicted permease